MIVRTLFVLHLCLAGAQAFAPPSAATVGVVQRSSWTKTKQSTALNADLGQAWEQYNTSVRELPYIYPQTQSSPGPPTPPTPSPDTSSTPAEPQKAPEDRGDLLLKGLFARGTDCIIDVSVIDLNAPSYRNRNPVTVLRAAEQNKKRHYLKPCLDQRKHFAPFILSTDGLLAPEARSVLVRIAQRLADKWQRPYSTVMSYLSARLAITLARACHTCLRGSRVSSNKTSFPRTPGSIRGTPSSPPGGYFAFASSSR